MARDIPCPKCGAAINRVCRTNGYGVRDHKERERTRRISVKIDQVTKYRCDGCAVEQQNPNGWMQFTPLRADQFMLTIGDSLAGEHYCPECVGRVREAAKRLWDAH